MALAGWRYTARGRGAAAQHPVPIVQKTLDRSIPLGGRHPFLYPIYAYTVNSGKHTLGAEGGMLIAGLCLYRRAICFIMWIPVESVVPIVFTAEYPKLRPGIKLYRVNAHWQGRKGLNVLTFPLKPEPSQATIILLAHFSTYHRIKQYLVVKITHNAVDATLRPTLPH